MTHTEGLAAVVRCDAYSTLAFQGNVHNLPPGDYELIHAAVERALSTDTSAIEAAGSMTGST